MAGAGDGRTVGPMLSISEHNKQECIKRLNLIIPEIPFIKSFGDDCLLERLLNLISLITTAFDDPTSQSLDPTLLDSDADREAAIRSWLERHYTDRQLIDSLDFADAEDRTRVTALIINILFKLRHSLKDVEQYLDNCPSFLEFDQQLSHITRWDRLLSQVQLDSNRWRSEAQDYKVKYDESRKLIDKYQQNEIFNYNCNPRNQNLYKSRINETLKEKKNSNEEVKHEEHSEKTDIKVELDSDKAKTNESQMKDNDCPSVMNSSEPPIACLETKSAITDIKEEHLCYKCMYCDHSFATNYQMNLHLLQEHATIKMEIPTKQITSSGDTHSGNTCANGDDMQAGEQPLTAEPSIHKSTNNSSEGVFKCLYSRCGHTFANLSQLQRHFSGHKPNFNRLLSHIFGNSTTNAVLNRLRGLPPGQRPSSQHKKFIKPYSVRNGNNAHNNRKIMSSQSSRSLLRVKNRTKHHMICGQTYVCPTLANGRSPVGSHQLLRDYITTTQTPNNSSVVPIVSTPDFISHYSSSDEELEGMDSDDDNRLYSGLDINHSLNEHSFGIGFVANHQ